MQKRPPHDVVIVTPTHQKADADTQQKSKYPMTTGEIVAAGPTAAAGAWDRKHIYVNR